MIYNSFLHDYEKNCDYDYMENFTQYENIIHEELPTLLHTIELWLKLIFMMNTSFYC